MLLSKFQSMEEHNPKEFWKLVKSIKSNNSNDIEDEISPLVWHNYFKYLNGKKELPKILETRLNLSGIIDFGQLNLIKS